MPLHISLGEPFPCAAWSGGSGLVGSELSSTYTSWSLVEAPARRNNTWTWANVVKDESWRWKMATFVPAGVELKLLDDIIRYMGSIR